jgi:hypothetical protein
MQPSANCPKTQVKVMLKMMSILIAASLSTPMAWAQSSLITDVPQIGPHHRLFIYEKNENPQNILVVYSKLNERCQIQPLEGGNLFDFYWRMDRKDYKPTASLIKSGIRERLQVTSVTPSSFDLLLTDLTQVQTDLPEGRLSIEVSKNADGSCEGVKAFMAMGPSDGNARIQLESIYAEAAKTWNPMSRKLISVTIKGTDVKTGNVISHRFMAR